MGCITSRKEPDINAMDTKFHRQRDLPPCSRCGGKSLRIIIETNGQEVVRCSYCFPVTHRNESKEILEKFRSQQNQG